MKVFVIAWQDTLIRLRDGNALVLMLLAPLVVSAIMGTALSRVFSGAPLKTESLLVVNHDPGPSGRALVAALDDANQARLFTLTPADDLAAARAAVADGKARAVVYVPPDFGRTLEGVAPAADISPASLELYVDQSSPPAAALTRDLLAAATSRLSRDPLARHLGAPPGAAAAGAGDSRLSLHRADGGAAAHVNSSLAFFAPSMAIFFLMFTMFDAPRTILAEREAGTLGRLLRTPTSSAQILLGKLGGAYLTGILQFLVLVVASRLIFGLRWGNSMTGLALMVIATVVAASGLGAVIASFSKDVNQAEVLGGGIAIVSAGLGGNFFPPDRLPGWLQIFSYMTVNRWGLEGFSDLTMRGLGLREVLPSAGVLLVLACAFFALSFWKFSRRLAT